MLLMHKAEYNGLLNTQELYQMEKNLLELKQKLIMRCRNLKWVLAELQTKWQHQQRL